MRILFVLVALFTLAGCEGMNFVAVDYHNGYNYGPYVRPVNHISYTLGYYSGSYYNGYQVYGTHGHRYYHAPRYYSHHRTFARPVVVQHVHVHTSYCEHTVRPRNNNRQRDNDRQRDRQRDSRSDYVQPQVRNEPRSTPPARIRPQTTPPARRTPPQVRNDRREDRVINNDRRENRQDRQRDPKRKRK